MRLFADFCRVIDPRHFKIDEDFLQIGVSGGRSSGLMATMIWQEVQTRQDVSGIKFCFQNTGFEDPATIKFLINLRDVFGIPLVCLEFVPPPSGGRPKDAGFKVVELEHADMKGTPFLSMFNMVRDFRSTKQLTCIECDGSGVHMQYNGQMSLFNLACSACNGSGKNHNSAILPNPVDRLCTSYLKLKTVHKYMVFEGIKEYSSVVGFRADEPIRIARMPSENYAPLAKAGIVKSDVFGWWKRQPFDLQIPTERGNCVGCFLKAPWKLLWIEKHHPGTLQPWADMEREAQDQFSRHRDSYATIIRKAESMTVEQINRIRETQREDELPCACAD